MTAYSTHYRNGRHARNINCPRSHGHRLTNRDNRKAWFAGYDDEDTRINGVNDGKVSAQAAIYTPGAEPTTHASTSLWLETISVVAEAMNQAGVWKHSGCVWIVPGTCPDDPTHGNSRFNGLISLSEWIAIGLGRAEY